MTGTTSDVQPAGLGADAVTAALRVAVADGRAGLVAYLPAGYPDMDTSCQCLVAAAEAGADVIEVGLPFSDPMMDGPTIQAANQVALDAGYGVADDFAMCADLTTAVDVPVLAMTYVTIPDVWGYARFADAALGAGVAGAILPDLPADEAQPWLAEARPRGLATVLLASSASSEAHLAAIAEVSTGFVYATGLLGVTGVKGVDHRGARALVERIRAHTDTPVAVGIGVKDRGSAAQVAAYADGVIVGSALVRAAGDGDPVDAPDRVGALVRELRAGMGEGSR